MAEGAMSADEQAALAGFTVSFFRSVPELYRVWKKARAGEWDGVRIVSEMRKTKWFKTHSERQRQLQLLRTSDPKEYRARKNKTAAQITAIAKQLGTPISKKNLEYVAGFALAYDWSEDQIRTKLANGADFIKKIKSGGGLGGLAGQNDRALRQLQRDYGIKIDSGTRLKLIRDMTSGAKDMNWATRWFTDKAKSEYGGLANDIDAGLTVRQAAQSYIDSMARLWEQNPEDIDLTNPTIRRALTSRDKDGKVIAQPIWRFEEDLRKDKRWLSTNNGRETVFSGGYRALQDMGLVF